MTNVAQDADEVIQFFRNTPEEYLATAGVTVDKQQSRSSDFGEWLISEPLRLSFEVGRVKSRIQWKPTEKGARFDTFSSFGIYVINTFTVEGEPDVSSCSIIEEAILHCPLVLAPITRLGFNRAHDRLHKELIKRFKAK